MSEFTEVTADNLRFIRGSRGLNQDQVAEILGLEKHNVSKIETGKRALADPEKKLLDWYFFGTMPKRITELPVDLNGLLEFDETEWRIIEILAQRAGISPREWIGTKIKEYLAVFKAEPPLPVQSTLPFEKKWKASDEALVAEEPPALKAKTTGKK